MDVLAEVAGEAITSRITLMIILDHLATRLLQAGREKASRRRARGKHSVMQGMLERGSLHDDITDLSNMGLCSHLK